MSLWIDVTGLVHGSGHFSGVPRVRTTLILKWLDVAGFEARYFEYDRPAEIFREVPAKFVRDLLARIGTGSSEAPGAPPVTSLSRLNRRAEKIFQSALFFFPQEARREALGVYAATLRFVKSLVAPLRNFWRRRNSRQPFPVADFRKADVLILLDWVWVDCDYGSVLARRARTEGIKISPLIYDLLPWRFPQFFSVGFGEKFCRALTELLSQTALAITVSEHARREIVAFCEQRGVTPPSTEIMTLGCEFTAEGAGQPAITGPYILGVGAVGVRKNYGVLYHVWRSLIEKHGASVPKLVIVGGPGFLTGDLLYQLAHDPVVRERVVVLDGIDDRALHALYANCLFTVYPSFYEGSGVPVRESLAAGKYCVASAASSIPEMGVDLADYHDPNDFVTCRNLIERAWRDETFRSQRESRIRKEFQAVDWAAAARHYLNLLRTKAA